MAPKPIVGRYKLYKAGTKKLVNWLAKTGSIYCDLKKVLKSLDCHFSGKKTQPSSNDIEEIEVTTRELIILAELIVEGQPPPDIPDTIITITRDVIKGREECAEWYSAQALAGDSELDKENNTHRHFITVLHHVLVLLIDAQQIKKTVITVEQKSRKSKKLAACEQDKLSNLFSVLQVEESLSLLDDNYKPPPSQAATSTTSPAIDFKLEMEEDDGAFATWCFLADLNDVRSFTKETWLEYLRGDISFLAASSVTDTAFGLLRCADEEFLDEKNGCPSTNWKDVLEYLGLTWFSRERAIWLCPTVHGCEPALPNTDVNIIELLCPIGYMCLNSYGKDAQDVCQALSKKKPVPTSCSADNLHCFHEFCCVLFKLAEEVHVIAHTRTCEHIVVDEFVQGLAQMHHNGKTPMWLVVACQIYLDIYNLLGTHVKHGVKALQETLRKNKEVRERLEEYWIDTNDDLSDVMEAVAKFDWVSKAYNRVEEATRIPQEGSHERTAPKQLKIKAEIGCSASAMERALPAHAGAILADIKYGLHDAGTKIANHNFLVLSTAHLYKALRAMGVLNEEWADMDWVLSSFKKKQPLVAKIGPAYDGEAAARCYLLALGLPLTEFARGGRKKTTKDSKVVLNEARKITINSPLLQKMSDRQQSWKKQGLGYSKSRSIEVVLQILTTSDQDSNSGLRESFTPVQLLSTFKKTILTNELALNFDYVSFTIACARLLASISNEVGQKSGPILGKQGMKTVDGPGQKHVSIVAHLLRSAQSSTDIKKAASLFSDHISSSGKTFIQQASDQSSGRIPKHLRPKIEAKLAEFEDAHQMFRTMFEYSNTHHVFSGRSMAAYHPSVKAEICTKEACCSAASGRETEPGKGKLHAFGSAIPRSIVEAGKAGIVEDPKKFLEARSQLILRCFVEHACGRRNEEQLREGIKDLTGFDIRPMKASEAAKFRIPWLFSITPESEEYDDIWEDVVRTGEVDSSMHGCVLEIPADWMVHESQ